MFLENQVRVYIDILEVWEGHFKVDGDNGMTNLWIILGILANYQDQHKIYFSKLIIRANKEDQGTNIFQFIATVVKFTKKASEAFIEAYFAGWFRVINHLQINQFHFDSKEALRMADYFVDNPTLEVNFNR